MADAYDMTAEISKEARLLEKNMRPSLQQWSALVRPIRLSSRETRLDVERLRRRAPHT